MSNNHPKGPGDDIHPSFCPYCGHDHEHTAENRYHIYTHPLKFQPGEHFLIRFFHRIVFSNNSLPPGIEERECTCTCCKEKFSMVTRVPGHPEKKRTERTASTEGNEDPVAKMSIFQRPKANETILFEELIDYAHRNITNLIILFGIFCVLSGIIEIFYGSPDKFFGISNFVVGLVISGSGIIILFRGIILRKNPPDTRDTFWANLQKNIIIVAILWCILLFLPSIITGSIEKFPDDKPLFITPVLFIVLVTVIQNQMEVIRTSFIPGTTEDEVLPVRLHDRYKRSPQYDLYKKISVQRFFFGKPYDTWGDLLTPPVIFGLIGIFIGMFYFVYFLPPLAEWTLFELITPASNPLIYTSWVFNFGWLLFYLPFWVSIGTVLWLSLITPYFVAKISHTYPLEIDHLQHVGGPEIFGDILLKSNLSIFFLALGFIAYLIWNYQTPPYTTIVLMSFFPVAIFFGFFYPLYPIHLKMKESKFREIDELRAMIDYHKIKDGTATHDELHLISLRMELIDRISTKNEWPIRFDVWVKVVSVVLIPAISILFNLYHLWAAHPLFK